MIIRGDKVESNFYILDKTISEDRRLSFAARGLLIFLLGKPNAWRVSIAALINVTSDSARPTGRDGIYSLLHELVEAGYVLRSQSRNVGGKMAEVDYTVFDAPQAIEPLTAQPEAAPLTAQPYTANPIQVSIEKPVNIETPIYLTPENIESIKSWAKQDGKYTGDLVDANIEYFINYCASNNKRKPYKDYAAACRNCIIGNWAKFRGVVTANNMGARKNDRTAILDELTGRNRQQPGEREVFSATN